MPDPLWKQGVVEYKDILKLIVCTDEFDARLMSQPALDLPRTISPGTRGASRSSLDQLFARVQTRDRSRLRAAVKTRALSAGDDRSPAGTRRSA